MLRILLLGIAIAAVLIATVPAIRYSGTSRPKSENGQGTGDRVNPSNNLANFRSGLGASGGLGNASMTQGAAGALQVYTVKTIGLAAAKQPGAIVRLRLSRPTFQASAIDENWYSVAFIDQDVGGAISVRFPKEGAKKLDLIERHSQPGLTFYVQVNTSPYTAVGTNWRADTKTYTW